LALVCATLIGGTSGGAERTTERFYMVVYGAQEAGVCPMSSHCFATFARIIAKNDTGSEPIVELRHINWFSRRGHETGLTHVVFEDDGRPVEPESGENRTTRDALFLAHRRGLKVTRLGPFEVDRGLYERARRQIDLLEGRIPGRRVLYKSLDLGYREGPCASALNCIHAISDIDRERGALRTFADYGEGAARRIVLHLGRWIKGPGQDRSQAWALIWQATWRPDAPLPLRVVDGGSPPPSHAREGPPPATGTAARSGGGVRSATDRQRASRVATGSGTASAAGGDGG
jgi:hypothetical protein